MGNRMLAALVFVSIVGGPAAAQPAEDRGGVPTETQLREAGDSYNPIWDLVGCLGLIGLFGFWRSSDNDGYTDDPI
ncbi:MAG TPA: hypothetical protein VFK19_00265 [Sphingomicrobium sp.]|jgi:hypothetical protein|nr:hypothetical protein [Sphingomicrobium sp.]